MKLRIRLALCVMLVFAASACAHTLRDACAAGATPECTAFRKSLADAISKGDAAMTAARHGLAVKSYSDAVLMDPDNTAALLKLGDAWEKYGNTREALKAWRRVLVASRADPQMTSEARTRIERLEPAVVGKWDTLAAIEQNETADVYEAARATQQRVGRCEQKSGFSFQVTSTQDSAEPPEIGVTHCGRDFRCKKSSFGRLAQDTTICTEEADSKKKWLAVAASVAVAKMTNCSDVPQVAFLKTNNYREPLVASMVTQCSRDFACALPSESPARASAEAKCEETAESEQRTLTKVVIDRLTLETGCSSEKIRVEGQSQWVRGTEHAFRLAACGAGYVCTTAAGRTDCKKALSAEAGVQAPTPEREGK